MRTRILGRLLPHASKALGGQNGCHGSKSDRVSQCRRLAWPPLRPGTKCSQTRQASTCSKRNQIRSVSAQRSNGDLVYRSLNAGFKNVFMTDLISQPLSDEPYIILIC